MSIVIYVSKAANDNDDLHLENGNGDDDDEFDLSKVPTDDNDDSSAAAIISSSKINACYMKIKGRGIGKLPNACPAGHELGGLLCYPICKKGYINTGLFCQETCKAGEVDDGLTCRRPYQHQAAEGKCPWYDLCGMTLALGCKSCPDGWNRVGCDCYRGGIRSKHIYGRGAGTAMTCADNMSKSGGLCYKRCQKPEFKGVGPLCFQTRGQEPYSVKCNRFMFADTNTTCKTLNKEFVKAGVNLGKLTSACGVSYILQMTPLSPLGSFLQVLCPSQTSEVKSTIPNLLKKFKIERCPISKFEDNVDG